MLFKTIRGRVRFLAVLFWLQGSIFPWVERMWLNTFSRRTKTLDSVLEEVCLLAEAKGFKFKRPEIRKIYPEANRVFQTRINDNKYVCGVAVKDKLILIMPFNGIKVRMQLAILVAHELGHILDVATKRKGHPFFESSQVKDLDSERFADAFVCYLFGKLVFSVASKNSGFSFDETMILNLDLNV